MNIVIDASVVVAALTSSDTRGQWAEEQLLTATSLLAPDIIHTEVTHVLRRLEHTEAIDTTAASLAFNDLRQLPIDTVPFAAISGQMWELRHNLSAYDAAYAATAQVLNAPLATLDVRLANAPGTTCEFALPPSG